MAISKNPILHGKRQRSAGIFPGIFVIVGIAVIAVLLYWDTNKEKIIGNKLEKAVTEKTQGLYKIAYDDMELNEVNGTLVLNNISVIYDSAKFRFMKQANQAPSLLFKISIPEIIVTGVKTKKSLIDKQLVARRLVVYNPEIELFETHARKDSANKSVESATVKQLLADLDLIQVDTLEFRKSNLTMRNPENNREIVTIKDLGLMLTGVTVDSINNIDSARLLFSRKANLQCEEISWFSRKGLQHSSLRNISLNSANNYASIGEFEITPNAGEDAYVKQFETQTDRVAVNFKNIKFNNLNIDQLFDKILLAESVQVGSTSLKVYRDLGIPRDNKNRSGTYPHQQVTGLPVDFYFRKAVFSNAFIEYRERNDITRKTGDVQFSHSTISIDNITNIPSRLAKNNQCRVNIDSRFLNITPLKAVLRLPLGSKNGDFSIEGSTGGVDAVRLNNLLEPMGPATIKKGNVEKLEFKLKGNNTHAEGTVMVLYDDLRIGILEIEKDKEVDRKGFTSLFANVFMNDENPDKNEPPRIAEVNHQRDMNRSFYNLVWKTVFTGINQTIGNKRKLRRP